MKNEISSFRLHPESPWSLTVSCNGKRRKLTLVPPSPVTVTDEKCEALPVFDPQARFNAPYALKQLTTGERWMEEGLLPGSVVVRGEDGTVFTRGEDYECEEIWGSVGRLESGRITEGMSLRISYQYFRSRIDGIVMDAAGKILVIQGKEHDIMPHPPVIPRGMKHLANIYYSRRYDRLTEEMIYPVLRKRFLPTTFAGRADEVLPRTMAKLRSGEELKILAWGDSVTSAVYLPENQRWQTLFAEALCRKFSHSRIEMKSHGWGGRTVKAYLDEPEGSPHHFVTEILNSDADLIVSEFVNDASQPPEMFIPAYETVLKAFRERGKEWLILTPHWILPSWMENTTVSKVRWQSDDNRRFVHFLREFALKNGLGLADGSGKYAQWAEMGIPYMACMTNGINHPDVRGMKVFVNALMEVFPDK